MAMSTTSQLLLLYALFLFCSGVLGFALAGFESKAKTSLIMGTACAVVCIIVAILGRGRSTTVTAHKIGMSLTIGFATVFVWRAIKASGVPDKLYLAYLLTGMTIGSIVFFILFAVTLPSNKITTRAPSAAAATAVTDTKKVE